MQSKHQRGHACYFANLKEGYLHLYMDSCSYEQDRMSAEQVDWH